MSGTTYTATGPLLSSHDGGQHVIDYSLRAMEQAVGKEAVRRIHDRLGHVLKHPTGFYSSRVIGSTRSDGYAVTDSNVVYGPWLEGVSSRNTRSRFKGYHTFQQIGQQLDHDTETVIQPQIHAMMGALNGGN